MEQPAEYYDALFRDSAEYRKEPRRAPWAHLWRWIAEKVPPDANVVELGCGPGHLAHMLKAESYLGIDFSLEAKRMFEQRNPNRTFIIGTLPGVLDTLDLTVFDTVVACEFLEHVQEDRECLGKFRQGTWVVATVPMFDDPGHVRHFRTEPDVRRRYEKLFRSFTVFAVGPGHYGLEGVI